MSGETFYDLLLAGVFVAAAATAVSLMFRTAPYGRHNEKGTGPQLGTRIGWVYMESPSVFAFAYFFLTGANASQTVPFLLFLLWQSHYMQRTLMYPFLMRVKERDSIPFAIATSGFVFNMANSYLNAKWIGTFASYSTDWLRDPRFIVGVLVFAAGYYINRRSDKILRNLRKPGETAYKIPYGGMFRFVSCPNHFGEIVEWCGWALATWSMAGLSLAAWTLCNLAPRAVTHHRWYQEKFPDYPSERKALIPFVL